MITLNTMTIEDIKKKIEIECQVLALMRDMPDDGFKSGRIACQVSRIGDLKGYLIVKELAAESPQSEAEIGAVLPPPP